MLKRSEAVNEAASEAVSGQKHGSLDADASARLEDLLDVAKRGGLNVTAGELMSKAIRLYHLAASDLVTVTAVTTEARQSVN